MRISARLLQEPPRGGEVVSKRPPGSVCVREREQEQERERERERSESERESESESESVCARERECVRKFIRNCTLKLKSSKATAKTFTYLFS